MHDMPSSAQPACHAEPPVPSILLCSADSFLTDRLYEWLSQAYRVRVISSEKKLAHTIETTQPDLIIADDGALTHEEWFGPAINADAPMILILPRGKEAVQLPPSDSPMYAVLNEPLTQTSVMSLVRLLQTRHKHPDVGVKPTQRLLASTDQRLRLFLEHAQDYALVILDTSGKVVNWMGGAEPITGWSAEEMLGQSISRLFTLEDLERGIDKLELTNAAQNQVADDTRWHVRKDGNLFFADGATRALYDDSGAHIGFGKIFRDSTLQEQGKVALRESQDWLERVIQSVADGIYVMAPDGTCSLMNAAGAALLGYSQEEVLGKSLHWLIHYQRADGAPCAIDQCAIARAVRTGVPAKLDDEVFWRKDGSPLPVRCSVNPITRGDNIFGAVVAFTDITVRKQIESNILDSERQLRDVLDRLPEKVFTAAANGDIDYANPTWLNYTGKSFDELNFWGWVSIVHPDDIDKNIATWQRSISTGEPFEFEQRFKSAAGEYRWHISRALPVKDENGVIVKWVGTNTDSHDLKSTELKLTQSLAKERMTASKLARLAQTAFALRAEMTIQGLADRLASGAREILGTHQAVVSLTDGRNWSQAITGVSLSEKYEQYRSYEVKPNGTGIYAEVCRTRLTQEQLVSHSLWRGFGDQKEHHPPMNGWLAVPLQGHDGRNLGLVQLSDKQDGDFSEEDEALLTQLAVIASVGIENVMLFDSLVDQDRRKDDFLATLAHELRGPLAPLTAGFDLLRKSDMPGERQRVNEMMERQLKHLVRLVDDLLDVARVNRGKINLQSERLPIVKAIESAIETGQPLINQLTHQLTVEIVEKDLYVYGDFTRLSQVFSNLLTNAAKYTPPGGRIAITVHRQGDFVVVEVSDNGIGIDPKGISTIFELFAQAPSGAGRAHGGLGIGLSVVKKLVEMHEGRIEASSEGQNTGTTFTVYLPLCGAAPAPRLSHEPDDETSKQKLQGCRVLIVDDHCETADTLALLLASHGLVTRACYCGREALPAAIEMVADVILMDISLPDIDGYEAAALLRSTAITSGVVIIAVTGWGGESHRQRAEAAGFDELITKPVNTAQLMDLLGRLVKVERAQ